MQLGIGLLIGLLLGAAIGWLVAQKRAQSQTQPLQIELEKVRLELASAQTFATQMENNYQQRLTQLEQDIKQLQDEKSALAIQKAELGKEMEAAVEKLNWLDSAQKQMREAFEALAGKTLSSNSTEFLKRTETQLSHLVTPLKENLVSLGKQVQELETKREGAYKGLQEQLKNLAVSHTELQRTTVTLTQALRSPTVRGRWGELQLRRVVEMAGMSKNVSYSEQVSVDGSRPDMIANLPNGGILPLDAKAPLEAYLDAMQAQDDSVRKTKLVQHAKAMKSRVRELGQKQYWTQFDKTPDFVVMFVPNEACLGAAFEADPDLLNFAINQHVLIASPVTLLALLKAVAYGWQQQQITENSRHIAEQGELLYQRLKTFLAHLSDVQKNLNRTVQSLINHSVL